MEIVILLQAIVIEVTTNMIGYVADCVLNRGYWYDGVEEVQQHREKIANLCPADEVSHHESMHSHSSVPFVWYVKSRLELFL